MSWAEEVDGLHVATRDAFGESVQYAPAGGAQPFAVVVEFDLTSTAVDLSTGALQRSSEPRIRVRLADFAVAPAVGDRVTRADGTVWSVVDPMPDGTGGSDLNLRRV